MSPKKNHSPVKQGASVRRVTKPVEVLDEDDINLLISAPPTLKPKSQLPKRKATTAPSDSSEVEILEYPTPSKKKIRALSPAGLAKDPEVPSIASPRVASSANGPGNSGLNTFSRPKRIIKMTEKAQAQVADPVVQPPAVKPSARGQKKIDISALTTVPTPEISPSIKKESTPPIETAAGDLTEGVGSPKVRRKGRLLRIESDDELPEVSELFNASSPNLSDSTHQVSNPFIDDEANENSAEDPSESDQTGEGLAVWEQEAGSGDDELAVELASPMSVIDSDDENPEDPNAVMQKRFQNHILACSYENLPHLERYYAIAPYPSDNRSTCDDTYAFMDFSVVAKAMGRSDAENLVALINGFLTYSTFVYLPRADPDLLVLEGRKLKLAARPGPAICLMPGVVTESYLFKSLMIGRPGHEFPAHGLTIACF
ncbi:hypothetical protein BDZ94DRAFT_1309740 [Collybia nuda]|uniref:Uncharacterized protein n=1 Tax=Collybia nuda TaxID=64659 RepID=A0A9P5Y6W8_9AGAR|nr:hypothetical protein BDZ94DRAFT_1309740 [Collybia nuda]